MSNKQINKNTKDNKQKGTSLIELLIYIAIVAIFISGVIRYSWDLIYGRVKSGVQIEVNQNLRLASKRFNKEIRNAININSVNSSTLSLVHSDPNKNPTVFSIQTGTLYIGQGSTGSCPTNNPCPLTSESVIVSMLQFTDLSNGNSRHIKYSITVEHTNPSNGHQWNKIQTYTSSVELRSL